MRRDPFAPHTHRKPTLLRRFVRRAIGVAVFAFCAGAVAAAAMLATMQPAPPNPIMTPAQLGGFGAFSNVQLDAWTSYANTPANARACSDAEWLRHVDRTPALHADRRLYDAAWSSARASALHASPALRRLVLAYVDVDRGYVHVVAACQQVTYGQ